MFVCLQESTWPAYHKCWMREIVQRAAVSVDAQQASLGWITSSFLWHILQDQLTWTAWLKISFALTTSARMTLDCSLVGSNAKLLTLTIMSVALSKCECVTRWMWWTWWTVVTWYNSVAHDSVLMLPFSCSHRPGVCINRPNCMARSDKIWGKGLANFHILAKLNPHHTLCRYQCTVVGRVGNRYVWQGGQTENQSGQRKNFSARIIKQMSAHPGLKPCRRPCSTLVAICL